MSRRRAAIVLLSVAIGISFAMSARNLHAKVSAQDLLREAARDGGPFEDILTQQARQGYYNDALATARLATANLPDRNRDYEFSGWIKKLIEIRAENGDINGAKHTVQQFSGSILRDKGHEAMMEIAHIQVNRGDLAGALQSCASSADKDDVMEHFGERQIADGDFDGALKTAQQVGERSAYNLFYDLGSALRERGEQKRLRELASHMTDRKRAAEFVEAARFNLYLEPSGVILATPCDEAAHDASMGEFTQAWVLFDKNNCDEASFIAVREYPTNPAEAERELLKRDDKLQLGLGLTGMAESAAKGGDVSNALRLLDTGRRTTGDSDFCLDCIRLIAWAWTLKGQTNDALRWARSLPVTEQRGFALLGVAQALAHPRPK